MSEETKYRMNAMSSRIAQYTIIDTLHTLISYKNKEPSLKCIHSVEKSMFTLKY